MGKSERKWIFILILLAGLVLGGLLGKIAETNNSLSWLNFGHDFKIPEGFKIDLMILVFSLGLTVKITVANIIGILIGLFIAKLLKY